MRCERVWDKDAALQSIEASFSETKECNCASFDFVIIDMDDPNISFAKIAAIVTQKNSKTLNHKTRLIGISISEQMNRPVCESLGAVFASKGISGLVFSALINNIHPETP